MQIQISTDHNIEGHEVFIAHVRSEVENTLNRFRDTITRVDVHLSDENGEKKGLDDKRCVMEVRLRGHRPLAVTQQAASVNQSVSGAVGKMDRLIENTLDRLQDQMSHRTDPPLPGQNHLED